MHLARAGSSGLASSTVALKLKCAFGSSGLERMGLESGCLETINRIWRRLGWTVILSKNLEASKAIWLERARADWPRALWSLSFKVHLARAGSSETPSGYGVLGPTGAFWEPKFNNFRDQSLIHFRSDFWTHVFPIRLSPLQPNEL
jgi:hypothetical protein